MVTISYDDLPLLRMRVIDEKAERNGRLILNSGEKIGRFGTLENQFICGSCRVTLAVGARTVVSKLLYKCRRCGGLNEVEDAAGVLRETRGTKKCDG